MKVKLSTILIITGIILWLSIAFFYYSSRYSSAARQFPVYSKKSYEYFDFGPDFKNLRCKLTLVLLKNDMVFGYYENSVKDGKIISITETDSLLQDGLKKFSKDSLVVILKFSREATYDGQVDMMHKLTRSQIRNYKISIPDKNEKEFLKLEK